ncbi:MAG: class I SAM-dependent methyltransferase [Actinomycetia bacterium]|nr:class I SAM-dependent methyltransferase [Actinomycetes bacterium]
MSDSWDDLASWWADEVSDDPAYEHDVHPVLRELMAPTSGRTIDLGCGEGQGMRVVGGDIVGTDLSHALLRRAGSPFHVVQARLPDLSWLRSGTFDRAFSVYLVDLIQDHRAFFRESARVVAVGGHLIVVINHPVYTAPGSAPLMDPDGEVLWRWGTYFLPGSMPEPAGDRTIEFFHRPMADLLSAAAAEGWALEALIERGLSPRTIARFPEYMGQEHFPRIAGFRWEKMPTDVS